MTKLFYIAFAIFCVWASPHVARHIVANWDKPEHPYAGMSPAEAATLLTSPQPATRAHMRIISEQLAVSSEQLSKAPKARQTPNARQSTALQPCPLGH